jgi:dihydroorotate dehydrogenase
MLLGGSLALCFAATRVVLPYDEAYLGMSAEELSARVPRLLAFMAHDRVTLAGTMLAVGIQYVFLAWNGIRRGLHWAKLSVVVSALAGFLSFFLFLGFGYFDSLHAFVTAVLFQFLLLAFQGQLAPAEPLALPNLVSDWRWRLANWGQMLLIAEGIAVVTAGVTISAVGITTVFVPEDLEFMGTTAEAIRAANPRLVPVVAHDRASFGGMLISVGLATLLPALWGIGQEVRWLWWMLALAGTVGYGATLAVHLHVGYTNPMHLAPAFGGLGLLWLALALLYPYMVARDANHEAAWRRLVDGHELG